MHIQREGGKEEREILFTLKCYILQSMTTQVELENTAVVKMIYTHKKSPSMIA